MLTLSTDRDLFELLRDDSDIRDLLEAYGETVPEDDKLARQKLKRLLDQVSNTSLISTLLDQTQQFAMMCRELFDFCVEVGLGISGEIQVKTDEAFLQETAFNSGWVYSGRASWHANITNRANALASELEDLSTRLAPEEFVESRRERVDGPELARMRRSPFPEARLQARIMARSLQKTNYHDCFLEGDFVALQQLSAHVMESAAQLPRANLGPALLAALFEFSARCEDLSRTMADNLEPGPESAPTTELVDNSLVVLAAIRSLAEDAADAERAERGLCDFLRSDFWYQRWRIYELWLLVRILKLLRRCGARIQLKRVANGAWNLEYSRATEPVATCTFPTGTAELYYQLYRKKKEAETPESQCQPAGVQPPQANGTTKPVRKADMPDLALLVPGAAPVLIVDPKHGRSYSKKKVKRVLTLYSSLGADFTAVVNYFPMKAYPLEEFREGTRRMVLLSDVRLNGSGLKELEAMLEDTLNARHLSGPNEQPLAPISTDREPPKPSYLLYWADKDREVDEKRGLWVTQDQSGPIALEEFGALVKEKPKAISATVDGSKCILQEEKRIILLSVGHETKIREGLNDCYASLGWSNTGKLYCYRSYRQLHFLDGEGRDAGDTSIPDDRLDAVFAWMPDAESLICAMQAPRGAPPVVYSLHEGREWREILRARGCGYDADATLRVLGPRHGVVLFYGDSAFRLHPDRAETVAMAPILSASPSGLYRLSQGEKSRREGVTLLTVEKWNCAMERPHYIRFFGVIEGQICWSPDERQIAFLATRVDKHGQRYSNSEDRLLSARIRERHAFPASMPGQWVSHFAWVRHAVIKKFVASKAV